MRKTLVLIFFLSLLACNTTQKQDYDNLIDGQIKEGNFTYVTHIIDSIIENSNISESESIHYKFIKDSLHRVSLDFNKTINEVVDWIEQNHGFKPTSEQLHEWESDLSLEYRIINGEKRYFRNAAPNIFRVNSNALSLSTNEAPKSNLPRDELLVSAFSSKISTDKIYHYLLPPVSFNIRYTLTVRPDVVGDGELVRAWLPFPRSDISRQYDVSFINASQSDYIMAEDKTEHNSIYMERKAIAGEPTVFFVEFNITSQGEWYDLSKADIQSYNIEDEDYTNYISERTPHIVFNDRLRALTDSVVGGTKDPVEILQLCYRHVSNNYPWTSAIEYSTIPNISEYSILHQKGDCGQVAILLITMLRYKGIPARWQSGWMLHPGEINLHDWAEVYFEGIGWVPIDISFARGPEVPIESGREFFMSGIDSYRLYINSDYSGQFYPLKKYARSETVDFQRGEVETNDDNLYFDKWYYKLEVIP